MAQETEIPEDVMYEANLVAGHIEEQCVWGDGEGGLNYDRAAIIVARAILAERKRAIAAIHWVFSADGTKLERSMADEAINKINDPTFASAIRSGS